MKSNNRRFDITKLPLDFVMRSKVLETHELQEIELIRMEYMFRTDRNSISLLKDVLGDGWNIMTQSLLARNFLIWDEKKTTSIEFQEHQDRCCNRTTNLEKLMDFQPTKCQASGLIEATRLLQEDDCKAMILTGAAGTGKTAMTKWIIDQATEEGYATQLLSFTVSATTNIRNKVMKPASTIHAYIYDIENIDGKEVCRRKEIIHRDKCLYIIDEASLIPGVRSKNGWQTPGSILERSDRPLPN